MEAYCLQFSIVLNVCLKYLKAVCAVCSDAKLSVDESDGFMSMVAILKTYRKNN